MTAAPPIGSSGSSTSFRSALERKHHDAAFDVEGGARVPGRFLQRFAQHVLLVGAVLEPPQEAVPRAVADGECELQAAALDGDLASVLEGHLDALDVGVRVVDADAGAVVDDGR